MTRLATLPELLAGMVTDVPDMPVSGLTLDHRQVKPGMAFIALRGTRQHGLAYAPDAVAAGAAVVLYEPEDGLQRPPLSVESVPVPALRSHLGTLADRFNSSPSDDLFVVGVTGTDGKTSVTHFIAEALNTGKPTPRVAVVGTLGIGQPGHLRSATHTTPDVLTLHHTLADLRSSGYDSVAMEVSSHALDQGRVDEVRFNVAVLTNLSRDHLDYHGTVEAYVAAKRRLFHRTGLEAVVLNLDDAFGRLLADELAGQSVQVLGYGAGKVENYPAGSVIATDAFFDHSGIRATVVTPAGTGQLQAPVLGRFNLHNLLAALAVLLARELTLDEALQRLQQVWVVPGRMERVSIGTGDAGRLVVVDYAHTPAALAQVLAAVRVHTPGRLWCVFGCGGDRDRGKRPLMAQTVETGADAVIVTDDNPRSEQPQQIFGDIMQGFQHSNEVMFEHDRATAIRHAIAQAKGGDTVLIAGKGHETVQLLNGYSVPFDDREQAARALRECAL